MLPQNEAFVDEPKQSLWRRVDPEKVMRTDWPWSSLEGYCIPGFVKDRALVKEIDEIFRDAWEERSRAKKAREDEEREGTGPSTTVHPIRS